MENPFLLSGKTILVTGASSGIGRAIAITCSGMGARICITGRNQDRLQATLRALEGEGHCSVPANLTEDEDMKKLVEELPLLDGVVYSAGIGDRTLCKNIDRERLTRVMSINFDSTVLLQTILLEKKKIKKEASIVFIASRAAQCPSIGNAIYSASKGAVVSYAKCLALEMAPRLIRVNCICPAMVWTDLILQGGLSKEDLEESQSRYPLKRYGYPKDVACLAVYLLSDASAWMTGSCIDLAGGGEGVLTT